MNDIQYRNALGACLKLVSVLTLLGIGGLLGWTLRNWAPANLPGEPIPVTLILIVGLPLSLLLLVSQFLGQKAQSHNRKFAEAKQNLTQALQDERALRASNECIMQFSRDLLCSIDDAGIFTAASAAVFDIIGFRPDELIGRHYFFIVHIEDREATAEEAKRVMAGNPTFDFRNHLVHKDGRLVPLSWSAKWSEDNQAMFCVGRNITETIQAETLIKERRQFFSLTPEMFCILDIQGHFHEINPAFSQTLDYSREELVGLPYLPLVHPEDQPRVEAAIREMTQGEKIQDMEIRVFSHRGGEHWLQLNAALGEDQQIYVAARDISQAKASQSEIECLASRLSTILNSITDAFVTLDEHMHFTSVNAQAEAFLQRSQQELLGKPIWEILPESKGSQFDQQYQHAMATGESVFFEAYSESLESWMEVAAYPSKEGLAICVRSIQERKQADAALRRALVELERSNRELEDFAFVASHDLQEPLRKIQTFSDRLISKSDHLTDKERDYLARMQSAAKRMQALILDLLAYSRLSTRGNEFVSCDLNRIIDEILQDMEPTLKAAKAEIIIEPLPAINGDETQVRQVFQNLISNAVKFHPEDQPPHLHIHGEEVASGGLLICVRDEGIGFELRYRERMFQPFQRLHHRTDYPGNGIGLAIVKKILDRHGASITVESAPERGSTFCIVFPPSLQEHSLA